MCSSCHETRSPALGSAYRAGFAWGLERGFDAFVEIDADFSHDPAASAGAAGAARGGVRRLDRLPLYRGRIHPQLGLAPPSAVAWRQHLRLDGARARRGGLDGGLPRLFGQDPAQAGPRSDPGRGLRLPDRDDLPGQAAWRRPSPKCRSASSTAPPGESKMSSVIVVEALGLVTWWGLGRLARGLRRALSGTQSASGPAYGGTAGAGERSRRRKRRAARRPAPTTAPRARCGSR